MINIKGFLSILLIKKKTILTTNTLYRYLNYFSKLIVEKISIKNKPFLEDLSKGFKLKSVYTTKGKNNIEKACDHLVLNNKKLMICFIKK